MHDALRQHIADEVICDKGHSKQHNLHKCVTVSQMTSGYKVAPKTCELRISKCF